MKKLITSIIVFILMISSCISVYANEKIDKGIVSNGYTTFYMNTDGTVKGWGRNTSGEVGCCSNVNQLTPITIPELRNVKKIITGNDGSPTFYAINDGSVLSWGDNRYGQLGIGSTMDQSIPILVPNLSNIYQIVTNGYTAYAITSNGDVYAWGKNDYSQVGNNTTSNQKTPVHIKELINIVSITFCNEVVYAINNIGEVYAWGRGNKGQLGNNTIITAQKTPVKISGLSGITEVVTNGTTTFAITRNNEVYGWGENSFGQVGCRNISRQYKPVLISEISGVKDLILEGHTAYAIMSDGTLYGWGRNGYSQLADGGSFDKLYPIQIKEIPHVKQVISNGYSTCVLGIDGSVYAWGRNLAGEVGNGKTGLQRIPYKINSLNNISKIAGNDYTLFAIDSEGNVYSWGKGNNGQLGTGVTKQYSPAKIDDVSNIIDIQKTKNSIYAEDAKGTFYGWGDNSCGQMANNNIDSILTPIVILEDNLQLATTSGSGGVSSIVSIVGSINALTISVKHPLNISYTINPNIENSFCCTDIEIQNNSKVPVKVTIELFKSNIDSELYFENVLPEDKDWDNLSIKDSKKYIALGLQYVDQNEWISPNQAFLNPVYALELDDSYIGTLAKDKKGCLKLSAKYGLAFDQNYTAKHDLILIFSLI